LIHLFTFCHVLCYSQGGRGVRQHRKCDLCLGRNLGRAAGHLDPGVGAEGGRSGGGGGGGGGGGCPPLCKGWCCRAVHERRPPVAPLQGGCCCIEKPTRPPRACLRRSRSGTRARGAGAACVVPLPSNAAHLCARSLQGCAFCGIAVPDYHLVAGLDQVVGLGKEIRPLCEAIGERRRGWPCRAMSLRRKWQGAWRRDMQWREHAWRGGHEGVQEGCMRKPSSACRGHEGTCGRGSHASDARRCCASFWPQCPSTQKTEVSHRSPPPWPSP
jgi:hypothetical protein